MTGAVDWGYHVDRASGKFVFHDNFDPHLGRRVMEVLKAGGNRICQTEVVSGAQESCSSVLSRTVRLAHAMKTTMGLAMGDVVAVCCVNHLDSAIPLFACQYLGVVPVHLVVGMTQAEVKHIVSLARPKLAFSDPQMVGTVEEAIRDLQMTTRVVTFAKKSETNLSFSAMTTPFDGEEDFRCEDFDPTKELFALVCSSGTTGMPKLVSITHRSLYLSITFASTGTSVVPSEMAFLTFSPLYWVTGVAFGLSCVLSGVNRLISAEPFTVEIFKEAVRKYRPYGVFVNPMALNAVVDDPKISEADLSSIRACYTGGSYVDHGVLLKCQALLKEGIVFQSYGGTEPGNLSIVKVLENDSLGKIHPWNKWKIVDVDTEERLGPNKPGELRVKNIYMFANYYGDPVSSAAALDEEGYYKTGDLIYYTEEGYIYMLDRIKEMIKFRGYQISTLELENAINSLPGVAVSAVIGLEHPVDGEIPMAFVQRQPGMEVLEQTIEDHIANIFSDAKRLRGGVVFIDELPRTHTGKLQRRRLRELSKDAHKKE